MHKISMYENQRKAPFVRRFCYITKNCRLTFRSNDNPLAERLLRKTNNFDIFIVIKLFVGQKYTLYEIYY